MVRERGRWILAGVISYVMRLLRPDCKYFSLMTVNVYFRWGLGCARPNRPGVSMRITEFLDWIYSVTGSFS